MEYKKQLLIKVLTKLKPYRDLAEGILALVESGYADEKAIDGIIVLIRGSMKKIKDQSNKEKLQKGLELIQKIKNKEDIERLEEDVEAILDTI